MVDHFELTGDALNEAARDLEKKVNKAIWEKGKDWSVLEMEVRVDELVRSIVGPKWDWTLDHLLMESLPHFRITGYDYRRTR